MHQTSLVMLPKESYFPKDMLYHVSQAEVIREPRLHWHEFYEIEYVVKGSAIQTVNGNEYEIGPGFATLLSPVDFHAYRNIDPDKPLSLLNVKFQDLVLPEALRGDIFSQKQPKIAPITDPGFQALMFALLDEYRRNEYGRDQVMMNSIVNLCIRIMREVLASQGKEDAGHPAHSSIQEAVLYVRTHFRDNLSAEAVAKTIHLSPNYFSEYFKKQTGENFSLFVLRLRIDFAANLLKISDLSVKEIAFESGFNSAAYFSNTFKEIYGMSPDRFRRAYKEAAPGA